MNARIGALCFAIPVLFAPQAPQRIHGTIDLTIGGNDDAAEEYTFGRVVGLAMGADGRIYVADGQDQQIRVYSPEGKFIYKIGRKGSGPGEFTRLGAVAFAPDGLLWTRDEGGFRYQSFTVGASKADYKSGRLMHQHMRDVHQPIVFDASNNIVEIGRVNALNAGPYDYVRTTIGADDRGIAADTTRGPPEDSTGVRVIRVSTEQCHPPGCFQTENLYQPFGSVPMIAFARNGDMARALTGRYAVSVIALNGKPLRTLQRDVKGPPPTASERAVYEKRFDETLGRLKMSRLTAPFKPLALKPPLFGLQFAADGELWVQRSVAADAPHEADVYDKAGHLVAVAEWPARGQLMNYTTAIGRTSLAVMRDSLDAERVVRVRFK